MTNFPSDVLPVYTSDIFSIGKLVPSLHGPWSLDCCAKGLGLLCLEIVCTLQMMAVHCFKACVAIICFVAVTCHLLPVAIICVLQFVLLGVLPRAILRAPVRAFWRAPSCSWFCGLLQLQFFKKMKGAVYVFDFSGGATPGISPAVC